MPFTDRIERLATPRNLWAALALGGLVLLAIFVLRPTHPNYDTYYTLVWGRELAGGDLPDYDVFRTPTPHPLATLVGAALSTLGDAADRAFVLITLASFLGLVAALFRFTQILLGTLVALVATAFFLTRTDLEFFAFRAVVDIPFLALIFGAAVWELERRRAGTPVLILLALAGLLRPEAWLFAGAYWLYLVWPDIRERRRPARWVPWTALAASAPVLWLLADWAVTGEPLYSLTSTREVAGQFARDRGLVEAVGLIPDYVGSTEKVVNVAAGGLGALLAVWLLRRRALMALALVAIGTLTFLAIAVAGLSVIPRYLVIPSLVLNLAVGVAVAGWALVEAPPRARRAALAVAGLAFLLIAWRSPDYVRDVRKLNGQTLFSSEQHRELKAILDDARVVPLLQDCGRLTVPSHSAIPVVRWATGLPKEALEASIAQRRPPVDGLLLIGRTFNFEPAAARAAVGGGRASAQKWWSNYPLSTFRLVARNERWRIYSNCA